MPDFIDSLEGIWNNRNIEEKFRLLRETAAGKGYHEDGFFVVTRRCLYIISRMTVSDHDVKDLMALAYADYVVSQIRQALNAGGTTYLDVGFHELTYGFLAEIDNLVGGKHAGVGGRPKLGNYTRSNRRLSHGLESRLPPPAGTAGPGPLRYGDWEKDIKTKIMSDNVTHQFKHKDMLRKYERINTFIKEIIKKSFDTSLQKYYKSLKTKYESPEKRRDEILEFINRDSTAADAHFAKAVKAVFDDLLFQSRRFRVLREIYVDKKAA